ncbi:class I SAM-dependent methyltransferase [Pontibacterium granulatum]|uniref:class I SAM-dependent methyltransferase n=1 Tax=Pontibacterium granulatum TaxID=2036029 RepID=UPI00249B07C3|nr:class I SAM-dependent methyltransferase [Pontibacterium granulatum]MDI3325045.1 class I SAM-dependent methyltransferase [Pontibacterium granulatum]
MSAARDKWNARYQSKGAQPPSAPSFLQKHIDSLKPGSVLDIAAGDGAASLLLAREGFAVIALDISENGLERLAAFAKEQGNQVATQVCDLEQPGALGGLGQFDNAVITLYKPVPELWQELVEHVVPGGRVLLTTFNVEHHVQTGFSRRFCLEPGELEAVHPGLELIEYSSTASGGNWMDHYLFRRL